jgi:large subunit ribosomal protein L21
MFAVVNIGGFQEIVHTGDKLKVPTVSTEVGEAVTYEQVYLISKDGGELVLGSPTVGGASIQAKVLAHGKAEKIRVVKARRRKRYRRVKGHRQGFTEIEITAIKA